MAMLDRANHPHNAVILWDVASGKELGRLKGHEGIVVTLAFSPDGKSLVTGSADTTALLWDVTRFRKAAPGHKELSPAGLRKLWDALAEEDAAKAFAAINALAAAPGQSVPLLKSRLRPVEAVDNKHVAQLIADLDGPRFAQRRKARRELEKLGRQAAPALKKMLQNKPPLEVRKRIETLLERVESGLLHGEALRTVRAIEILERVGTLEARRVLESLAKGAPGAIETAEASAALRRLND